jgi:chromosome partitioning protein
VHGQFSELAQDILTSYDATPEPRAYLYHRWLKEQESQKKEAFLARLEGIPAHCVICGASLDGPTAKGFFYESGDRTSRGFLHSDCFVTLLCNTLYHLPVNSEVHALSLQMIRESARESVAVFLPSADDDGGYRLRFMQLDQHGSALLERTVSLTGFSEGLFDGVRDQLYLLLNESLAGYDGGLRNSWLAVHPVDEEHPQQVLQEPRYRQLQELHRRIGTLLEA